MLTHAENFVNLTVDYCTGAQQKRAAEMVAQLGVALQAPAMSLSSGQAAALITTGNLPACLSIYAKEGARVQDIVFVGIPIIQGV